MKELKVGVWNKARPETPSTERYNCQETSTTSLQPLCVFYSYPNSLPIFSHIIQDIFCFTLYSENPILQTRASSTYFGKQKYNTDIAVIQMNNYIYL